MPLCLWASPFITNTIAWPARRTAGSGLRQRGCILGNRTSTPTRSQGPSPPSRSSARTLTGHMFSHTLLRSCITRWADTFTPVILLWCCDRGIRCRDTLSCLPEKTILGIHSSTQCVNNKRRIVREIADTRAREGLLLGIILSLLLMADSWRAILLIILLHRC